MTWMTARWRGVAGFVPPGLSIAAGLLHALALAVPGDGEPRWWLQMLALSLLGGLLTQSQHAHGANWRPAALRGWLFATAWLSGTFWWLFISMHTYGGLAAVLAALAVFALAGVLGLYYAAACGLYVRWAPPSRMLRALLFAALWLLAELARARWFTGFGWGGAGYAHVDGPLSGYAPWLGVFGIGAITAWLAMALVHAGSCGIGLRLAALLVFSLPSVWQMGQAGFTRSAGSLQVALLQGNIAQDEKFQPGSGVPQALRWYAEQLQANTASLVVAPETAIPLLPQQLPASYWDGLTQRYAQGRQAALIGVPLGSLHEGYTNSTLGFKPGQDQPWRYDKHHLVPFGEFIPPFFKWFTAMMNIPLGDFQRGALGQPSFEWQGQRLATHICYEDLFGEELAVQFAEPAQSPTVLVNLSNIAWFGNTVAIAQHLNISRMRALEFERPIIRATNTGATAIVDHTGRVAARLPAHQQGVLHGVVEGRQGHTPYARWVARFGLWPVWLAALSGVLLVLLTARRQLQRQAS